MQMQIAKKSWIDQVPHSQSTPISRSPTHDCASNPVARAVARDPAPLRSVPPNHMRRSCNAPLLSSLRPTLAACAVASSVHACSTEAPERARARWMVVVPSPAWLLLLGTLSSCPPQCQCQCQCNARLLPPLTSGTKAPGHPIPIRSDPMRSEEAAAASPSAFAGVALHCISAGHNSSRHPSTVASSPHPCPPCRCIRPAGRPANTDEYRWLLRGGIHHCLRHGSYPEARPQSPQKRCSPPSPSASLHVVCTCSVSTSRKKDRDCLCVVALCGSITRYGGAALASFCAVLLLCRFVPEN